MAVKITKDNLEEIVKINKEIQDEIDYLELKKQEMASFSRLSNVASEKGYIYNNDSVASSTAENPQQ